MPPTRISQCGAYFNAISEDIYAARFQSVLGSPSPQVGSSPFALRI